jgi:hypothetical protein
MPMCDKHLSKNLCPRKKLKNRETNAIEIVVLNDGEGEDNPTTKEKYKNT